MSDIPLVWLIAGGAAGLFTLFFLIGAIDMMRDARAKDARAKAAAASGANFAELATRLGAIQVHGNSAASLEQALQTDVSAQQRADLPLYCVLFLVAADRVAGHRTQAILAVVNTLLPRGGERQMVDLAEHFWEVTYPGGWDIDQYISEHLLAGSAEMDEVLKRNIVKGTLILSLMHDPEGSRYMTDKSAYVRGSEAHRARMVVLCQEWFGSQGDQVFGELLASARQLAGLLCPQFDCELAD